MCSTKWRHKGAQALPQTYRCLVKRTKCLCWWKWRTRWSKERRVGGKLGRFVGFSIIAMRAVNGGKRYTYLYTVCIHLNVYRIVRKGGHRINWKWRWICTERSQEKCIVSYALQGNNANKHGTSVCRIASISNLSATKRANQEIKIIHCSHNINGQL